MIQMPVLDEPTPCQGQPQLFDALLDGPRAVSSYVVDEIAEMCGRCPIQAKCYEVNADEEWARVLRRGTVKRPPTVGPGCGTVAGYGAHARHAEHPCADCRKAVTAKRAADRAARSAA